MQFQMQGTATAADSHKYISHRFDVPQGATRLDIDFVYSPKRLERWGNLLTLSLFDPNGERGTGHRGQPNQHITLSAADATPGYIPGALPAGSWDILINCNLVNPGAPVEYRFDISIGFEAQPTPVTYTRGMTHPRGAGWYRGDLHGHTVHSDGNWDATGLLDFARQHQLDFVTLTDHNTVSGLPQMDSLSSDALLTMGGFELTTFYGHALALGIRRPMNWRVRQGQRSMSDIKAEVEAEGGLFVIAHPACPGDPICTGCHWDYTDLMPGTAGMVEIWNEQWSSGSNNDGAVELWYQWLNQGYHIYAEVGTDIHGPPDSSLEFGFNVVYAEEFDERAILEGVRRGHLYMTTGPKLEFTGQSSSGQTAMIGDRLDRGACQITGRWSACRAGDCLRFMVDGEVKQELSASADGEHTWTLTEGRKHWCLLEMRDANGNMRAVTNPIFIED